MSALGGVSRQAWTWVLILATIGVGLARVVVCYTSHMAFVYAYADYEHLDTNTFLGMEVAKRDVPVHLDSAIFSLLCAGLLLLPQIRRISHGAPWARNMALVLAAAGGLNTLSSLAVPSPWWYHALTLLMVALTAVAIVVTWRTPVIEDYADRYDAQVRGSGAS